MRVFSTQSVSEFKISYINTFINGVELYISDLEDIIINFATSETLFECTKLLISACKDCTRGVESVHKSVQVDRIFFRGLLRLPVGCDDIAVVDLDLSLISTCSPFSTKSSYTSV